MIVQDPLITYHMTDVNNEGYIIVWHGVCDMFHSSADSLRVIRRSCNTFCFSTHMFGSCLLEQIDQNDIHLPDSSVPKLVAAIGMILKPLK